MENRCQYITYPLLGKPHRCRKKSRVADIYCDIHAAEVKKQEELRQRRKEDRENQLMGYSGYDEYNEQES